MGICPQTETPESDRCVSQELPTKFRAANQTTVCIPKTSVNDSETLKTTSQPSLFPPTDWHGNLSFLSSRLSQFTKATKLFSTRDHPTKTNVAKEFHEACDGKTNTLVIIKSGQYIAGGYTEVAWSSSNQYIPLSSESQAFLFSVNKQNIYNNKDKRVGIYCGSGYGPIFGGGHDIRVYDNYKSNSNNSNLNHSYDASGVSEPTNELFGSYNFTIDEYEVYKLE